MAVNLRPSTDWPDRAVVAVGLARVAAVIDRIAADVDELDRARRVQDLHTAAVLPDRRAERRWRLAEPDLEFRAFCARKGFVRLVHQRAGLRVSCSGSAAVCAALGREAHELPAAARRPVQRPATAAIVHAASAGPAILRATAGPVSGLPAAAALQRQR